MSHAVRIHEAGGPEVLRWEEHDPGRPAASEALIHHTAIGVNFIDIYYRSGLYPTGLPFLPGREAAGVVEAVGETVETVRVGDRVAYASVLGSYCERRTIDARQLVVLPSHIDDETAAAIMLQGMTARYLIKSVYPITGGETILVHAAAGGVGLLLCQWASNLGATVIGTVSSDEKSAKARAAGCEYPIVTAREDFLQRTLEITKNRKLPVVYDSVGRDTFDKSLDCLDRCGLMVVFGQSSGTIPPVEINRLARHGSLRLTRPILPDFIATRADLETVSSDLFDAVAQGILRANVGQRFALHDAAQAHRAIEARQTTGSTILEP